MKLLLLTSHKPELVKVWVCQESSPGGSLLPPADLASIAASVRSVGGEVILLDLRKEKDPFGALAKAISVHQPDHVILNLTTTSAFHDYELLQKIPSSIKKLAFGTHAQSNAKEAFSKGLDGILVGDPESILMKMIQEKLSLEEAPGMLTVAKPDKAPFQAENLDSLPFPALDLLDLDSYHAPYIKGGNRFAILMSSRGCPFKCTYCLYPFLFGATARMRSPKNVVDEMEYNLKKFHIRDFYFLDATFNLSKDRIHQICDEIIARNLEINWICNMRVSPLDEQLLAKMKMAGCRWIFYGVEDQDLLRETKKGTNKNATVEAFKLTKAAGIQTMAFTMVFPREDLSEKEYSRFVLNTLSVLDADAFQCNMAIPFPGTPIFEEYKNRFTDLSTDWRKYDPHGKELPYRASQDLQGVKRAIYRNFLFTQPMKVAKVALQMSPKALAQQALIFLKKNILAR